MHLLRECSRHSIACIFFLVLCCAGFIAGYRHGVNHGYQRWLESTSGEGEYPVTYDVQGLIDAETNGSKVGALSSLSAELEAMVDPSYNLVIESYPAGSSLVILTDLSTHRQIERLLAKRRLSIVDRE